jgi:hypothetical protein
LEKKKCTIIWVKFGDDNTKFFHAAATQRHRHNKISHLIQSDGSTISTHQEKAHAFLSCFKARMGTTEGNECLINLQELITPHESLSQLSVMPSIDEMDKIIKHMPNDKSPGPDGFNGLFMKKCWHIISGDFYKLALDFFVSKSLFKI